MPFGAVWQELVEDGIEHSHDVFRFVVDDLIGFLVPEDWHGVFARVFGVLRWRFEVDFTQSTCAEDGIISTALIVRVGVILRGDLPGLWIWLDYSQWKELLETF